MCGGWRHERPTEPMVIEDDEKGRALFLLLSRLNLNYCSVVCYDSVLVLADYYDAVGRYGYR